MVSDQDNFNYYENDYLNFQLENYYSTCLCHLNLMTVIFLLFDLLDFYMQIS